MSSKVSVLLKLSGEIFLDSSKNLSINLANSIAQQILQLKEKYNFAIVIGGGNFFRGSRDSKALNLSESYGHYIGMLATQMNGLILKDCFSKNNLDSKVLSALPSPSISTTLSQNEIVNSIRENKTIIFSGGSGIPYFSTDTTAIIRALQIDAQEVWKCTKVDGIFDKDPHKFNDAKMYNQISYQDAIDKKLNIMDFSAFTLAQEKNLKIRVFNIFKENSILQAAKNENFGTVVY